VHPVPLSAQLLLLRVSDNHRFLVTAETKPFFYLGDTAWELFHRLDHEQAEEYPEHRARNGFTVIQAVALAELDGLNDPNPYGHRPRLEFDPLDKIAGAKVNAWWFNPRNGESTRAGEFANQGEREFVPPDPAR
jgi:hypothetical protein